MNKKPTKVRSLSILGYNRKIDELEAKIKELEQALQDYAHSTDSYIYTIRKLEAKLDAIGKLPVETGYEISINDMTRRHVDANEIKAILEY